MPFLCYYLQVASSKCDRDDQFIVLETQLELEQDCINLCDVYSTTALSCSFSAWTATPPLGGQCLLYTEDFADFLVNTL